MFTRKKFPVFSNVMMDKNVVQFYAKKIIRQNTVLLKT